MDDIHLYTSSVHSFCYSIIADKEIQQLPAGDEGAIREAVSSIRAYPLWIRLIWFPAGNMYWRCIGDMVPDNRFVTSENRYALLAFLHYKIIYGGAFNRAYAAREKRLLWRPSDFLYVLLYKGFPEPARREEGCYRHEASSKSASLPVQRLHRKQIHDFVLAHAGSLLDSLLLMRCRSGYAFAPAAMIFSSMVSFANQHIPALLRLTDAIGTVSCLFWAEKVPPRSQWMTISALVRFKPVPPAFNEIGKTSTSPPVLKFST